MYVAVNTQPTISTIEAHHLFNAALLYVHCAAADGAAGIRDDHALAGARVAQELPAGTEEHERDEAHPAHSTADGTADAAATDNDNDKHRLRAAQPQGVLTLAVVRVMQAIMQDMQLPSKALEDNVEVFARDQHNFGVQRVRAGRVVSFGAAGW
jgi:hypothetical protein